MLAPLLFVLAGFLANVHLALAQGAKTATLTDLDSYKAGRSCMRDCLYYLPNRNGCDSIDGCICRIDLQPQITTYLSTCISTGCTGYTKDINSGISIYQSYCSGKADAPEPVVTPVATQQVIETTIVDRVTVEATATVTTTNFATAVVNDVSTLTSFTRTTTVKVPSSLTQIQYQTFTAVFNSTESLRETLKTWGIGSDSGLTMQGKIAIGLGVGMGVFMVAFLVALCCCLSRRSELLKRNRPPGLGGNAGWPEETPAARKY